MHTDTATKATPKPRSPLAKSRLTNGRDLLPDVDGRSTWVRRCRDLIELHLADLGGPDAASVAETSIVRRACVLTVELERMENAFATAGQADADDLLKYQTIVNSLRRLLESIGLQRRPRDVTPTLTEYLAQRSEVGR